MNIDQLINLIEGKIKNPNIGLPEDIFLFISRLTPMLNVDLLIKNNNDEVLLTWRQKGQVYPEGWHIPGGIIRYKENILHRVQEVAKQELNSKIIFKDQPIAINEIMLDQKNRGHFVSLLFSCKLDSSLPEKLQYIKGIPKIGQWKWHKECPKNIIMPHLIYKKFF